MHLANSAANAVEPGRNILECRAEREPGTFQLTGLSGDPLDEAAKEARTQFLDVIRIVSPDAPLT